MQRLDKILSSAQAGSRKELRSAIRAGRVTVNGVTARDESEKFDETSVEIFLDGEAVELLRPALIVLNKPAGFLTAADDPRQKTVMDLIPERYRKFGVMPVGRLDKYTVGLLIISNDGALAHDLLSPKKHVPKRYFFRLEKPYDSRFTREIEAGIKLDGDATAKPASLEITSAYEGFITVTEGMFHLVKRIFEATGNKVTYLKRTDFGPLSLDTSLPEGRYRFLTDVEVKSLILAQKG